MAKSKRCVTRNDNAHREQLAILKIMHNRGKRRFVTIKEIIRRTGLSKTTITNHLRSLSNAEVCESIAVLSSDGSCAWGIDRDSDVTVGGAKSAYPAVVQRTIKDE